MNRPCEDAYGEGRRAQAYSELEFPGTYYLAFRDIPDLLTRHVRGSEALDFGCGAGRSTRFLKERGFRVVGVDTSKSMLARARERDPEGPYLPVPDGGLAVFGSHAFDMVLSAFTFDDIPDRTKRVHLFRELRRVLRPGGTIINLVSAPEIYVNEWVSFSTRDFAENRTAGSGDLVRISMLDVADRRPVEEILWSDADYRVLYAESGLEVEEVLRPLGLAADPVEWVSESTISPWAIYVLKGAA